MSAVIDILRRRKARGSKPPHGDGAKVALCVEGGGMRAVVSAGMVWALEHLGLTHAFDAVYGSSAGAINAAYFLAGQAAVGTTIYYEDINNRKFINLWRAIGSRPILDLGYLLDEVAIRRKPLDVARVIGAASPLSVMATDAATGRRAILRNFSDGRDLIAAMRAGATMPIVAGQPATYGTGRYFDASLTEDFLYAFSQNAGLDLHVNLCYGRSPHHVVEAIFKGVARALRAGVERDPRVRGLPTVKGAL